MNGTRRTRLAFGAVLAALTLTLTAAACGGDGGGGDGGTTPASRPSSPAMVTIDTPQNGDQFPAGTVIPVKVTLDGAKIVPQATKNITPTTGHLHLSVDDKIISMNYSTTNSLKGVKPGMHVMKVEFVAADHLPFDPRVIAAVTFEVTK